MANDSQQEQDRAPDAPTQMVPVPGQQVAMQTGETASTAVAAREKAQVEARYLMALHRPRNPDTSRVRLLKRCESPRFAAMAEYSKPVGGGKKATGGSIRLMEEVARQWGNIDVQSTVVFDDDERRIVRVTATDLESNYPASVDVILEKTVERKRTQQGDEVIGQRKNTNGETVFIIRATEDAFLVKQGANIAKARREMIRAIVPGDLVDEALERCLDTRKSEVKNDPSGARKRIADSFYQIGIMPDQLSQYLGKPSLEAITDAELETLRAIYTAIKDGETTWKEVSEESDATKEGRATAAVATKTAAGVEDLKNKMRGNGGAKKQEAAPAGRPETEDERNLRLDQERIAREEEEERQRRDSHGARNG